MALEITLATKGNDATPIRECFDPRVVTVGLAPTLIFSRPRKYIPAMLHRLRCLVILLVLPTLTLAQFGGFFQGGFPFGQNPFHQQDDGSQTPHREHKGWTEMEHSRLISGYIS